MKTIITIIALLVINHINAQLRVDAAGNVGLGTTWPNPGHKLDVRGDVLLTNYPAIPDRSIRLRLGTGVGQIISANQDILSFWSEWIAYHELHASNYFTISDIRYKSNISTIGNGVAMINKIRPVVYNIVDNKIDSLGNQVEGSSRQIGFIAQEIEKEFSEYKITAKANGDLLLDYDQIIPISVAAIQEQQKTIESLRKELTELKEQLNSYTAHGQDRTETDSKNQTALYQNVPNPFNQKTDIRFFVAEPDFRDASIMIFNMNGTLMKKYDIMDNGEGSIVIDANGLQAGMYIYSLIVNQREIDSKRMILVD